MKNHKAKIITFYTRKGGVGKTTILINLAVCLAEHNNKIFGTKDIKDLKILAIDNDSQGNLTELLLPMYNEDYWDTHNTIRELYIDTRVKPENVIMKSIYKNIDIIPSSLRHGDTNALIAANPSAAFILSSKLESIFDNYDYILIDNNPQVDQLVNNALLIADTVVAPVETFKFSISILDYLNNQVKFANAFRVDALKKAPLQRLFFLNKIDLRKAPTNEAVSTALKNAFNDDFMDSKIRISNLYPTNINNGQSIFDDPTNNTITRAVKNEFYNFAKELMEKVNNNKYI